MNRASLPLLEFSTLSVVILGCVIAVVPGADSYILDWFSPAPGQTPVVDAGLFADNEQPTETLPTAPTSVYPERFASLEPLPNASVRELALDWPEEKLPEPIQRSINPHLEPAQDSLTLFSEQPPVDQVPEADFEEMMAEPVGPLNVQTTEIKDPPPTVMLEPELTEPFQEHFRAPDSFEPGHVQPLQTTPTSLKLPNLSKDSSESEPIEPNPANQTERRLTDLKPAHQSANSIQNRTIGNQSKSQDSATFGVIKNPFFDAKTPMRPADSANPLIKRVSPDWTFEELPARQFDPPRSSERLPMAAESMQGNNDFRSRHR